MAYQLDTEDWKEFRKEKQIYRDKKRIERTNLYIKFCVKNDINYEEKTPYHFKLSKSSYNSVDIFPTSCKIHILKPGNNKFIRCDIIQFLSKHFRIN